MRQFADDAYAAAGWNLRRAPWAWIVALNLFWVAATLLDQRIDTLLAVAAGALTGGIAARSERRTPRWLWGLAVASLAAPFLEPVRYSAAGFSGLEYLYSRYWASAALACVGKAGLCLLTALIVRRPARPTTRGALAVFAVAVATGTAVRFASDDLIRAMAMAHLAFGLGGLAVLQLARTVATSLQGFVLVAMYGTTIFLLADSGYDYGLLFAESFHLPPLLYACGRVAEATRSRAPSGTESADRAVAWMLDDPWRTTALVLVAAVLVDREAVHGDLYTDAWYYTGDANAVIPGPGLLGLAFLFHLSLGTRTLIGKASVFAGVAAAQACALTTGGEGGGALGFGIAAWITPWLPVVTGWVAGRRRPLQRLDALDGFLAVVLVVLAYVVAGRGHMTPYFVGANIVALLLFHRAVAVDAPASRLAGRGAILGTVAAIAAWSSSGSAAVGDMVLPAIVFAAKGAVAALFVAVTRRVRSMTLLPEDHPALDARTA